MLHRFLKYTDRAILDNKQVIIYLDKPKTIPTAIQIFIYCFK